MYSGVLKWLNYKYPQNYILRNPLAGALIITILTFGFTVLYKPLGVKASRSFSIETTLLIYNVIAGVATILFVSLLKFFKWFRNAAEWTILKEFLSLIFVPLGIGVIIYISGFFIESSSDRLNLATLIDSIVRSFLIIIFPLIFFSVINYYYLFPQTINTFHERPGYVSPGKTMRKKILITSQLKKESLCFNPEDFIYAESDGNYVIFYLDRNNQLKKEIIRNSINSVEQQLSDIPYFLRTHRAFIVNLKKVISKHGTTLGYRLKISGTENRIPVSRNNTTKFNKVFSGIQS